MSRYLNIFRHTNCIQNAGTTPSQEYVAYTITKLFLAFDYVCIKLKIFL
jgi:hypothetical protein